MIILLYTVVPRGEAQREAHEEMTRKMQDLAEATSGFLGAEFFARPDGGSFGVFRFEDEQALAAWRDHPDHAETHRRRRRGGLRDLPGRDLPAGSRRQLHVGARLGLTIGLTIGVAGRDGQARRAASHSAIIASSGSASGCSNCRVDSIVVPSPRPSNTSSRLCCASPAR